MMIDYVSFSDAERKPRKPGYSFRGRRDSGLIPEVGDDGKEKKGE